jgi:hypothetical protein
MSHRGRHTSSLLLRPTAVTAIQVMSPGTVATKDHNNDLLLSPTLFIESFIQHRGESSPHQARYHGLIGWFHIAIEFNVNCEYSAL